MPSLIRRLARRLEAHLNTRRAYKFFMRDWIALSDLHVAADLLGTMRFTRNLQPQLLDRPAGDRIAVIAPHPDDEMLGPGGTLLRAIAQGARVRCIYLTSGNPGEGRREEAERIALAYGYETVFLDFPPGRIPVDDEAAARLRDAVVSHAPATLFLPFLLDDHDEHRRASHLLWRACETAEEPEARGALGKLEIWAYQVYTALIPNVVVDISDLAETKAAAVREWASQAGSRDWGHYCLGLNAFNSRFVPTLGRPAWVEAFFVVPAPAYLDWCARYFADPGRVYYMPEYRGRKVATDGGSSPSAEE